MQLQTTPVETPRRRGGLFRQHDFRMLWTGRTVSWVGTSMSVVSMPLVAVGVLHTSTFVVGLLQAAASLPWLLFGFPAGAWADRLRKRPVLILSNVTAFVMFLSVPVAAWAGYLTVPQLVLVEFVGGVGSVFFSCAYSPFLRAVVPKADRLEANGKLQGSANVAKVIGPSVGGAVAQFFGPLLGVLGNAISFAVSAVSLIAIRVEEPAARPSAKEKPSLWSDIVEGVRFTCQDSYLLTFIIFAGLANFGDAVMEAVSVVFLVRTAGLPASLAGVMVALMGLGGVAGALLPGRITRRFGTARGMVLCLVIGSPFTLLMPLTEDGPRAVLFLIGGFIYLMGVVASNIIFSTFQQDYVPENLLGRTSSVTNLLMFVTMPLGALTGAALATAYGTRTTMWISALIITLSVGALLVGPLRGRRDFPEAVVPAEAHAG